MRIGIDIRLKDESGVGRYIRNLVKWLGRIDRRNEYVLFTNRTWNTEHKTWKTFPVNVRWHSLQEQIFMPYLLRREKLDLVHFPYFNAPIFYSGKFVVTIHDLIIDHFATGRASTLHPWFYRLKYWGYKLTMRNALRRAEKIIVPSKATKNEVLEHYQVPSEKVVVIYEGTSEEILNSKFQIPNSKLKTLKLKKFLLYVGNAYPHKNLERLLQAFLRFKVQGSRFKEKKDIKLILVGKEDFFYKRLTELVGRMELKSEVIFTGYVSDEKLRWLYENAIALIIPSLMEGFGLPALEAMANKCLVLASDIPALREICREAAIYFDPQDINEMIDKMTAVIYHTTEYGKKRGEGKERVKEFSWRKMAEETLKVYEKVLKE